MVLSRRTLGSGLTALAVSTALATAGCDTDQPLDLPGLPAMGEEPDADEVRAALRDEQLVLDHAARVRRRHPGLRSELAATVAVHEAHVELLERAVDDSGKEAGADGPSDRDRGAGPEVASSPSRAAAQLVRLERSLTEHHVATALKVRSGVLARVLASMSAAAAQQAVLLAPLGNDDGGPR